MKKNLALFLIVSLGLFNSLTKCSFTTEVECVYDDCDDEDVIVEEVIEEHPIRTVEYIYDNGFDEVVVHKKTKPLKKTHIVREKPVIKTVVKKTIIQKEADPGAVLFGAAAGAIFGGIFALASDN